MKNSKLFLGILLSLAAVMFSCEEPDTPEKEVKVTSIELNKTKITLMEGEQDTLTVTFFPENATPVSILWAGNLSDIATIDNGIVTAHFTGQTVVSANAGALFAFCEVTVLNRIDWIAITPALTMIVGNSETITTTIEGDITPASSFHLSSSDNSIATVSSNGKITAVSVGTAIITAEKAGKTATCTVTVKDVESITLDKNLLNMVVPEQAILGVKVPYASRAATIFWTSSNNNVVKVSSSGSVYAYGEGEETITAVGEGTATITAKAGTKTAVCEVNVYGSLQNSGFVTINGVKWATCNIDAPGTFANNIADFGLFYQWDKNRGWSTSNPMICTDGSTVWSGSAYYSSSPIWQPANDPSPMGWRLPTKTEFESLVSAESRYATINGVKGRLFSSGNNIIFLPNCGYREFDGFLSTDGGYYWSATASSSANFCVTAFAFMNNSCKMTSWSHSAGFSLRSVVNE